MLARKAFRHAEHLLPRDQAYQHVAGLRLAKLHACIGSSRLYRNIGIAVPQRQHVLRMHGRRKRDFAAPFAAPDFNAHVVGTLGEHEMVVPHACAVAARKAAAVEHLRKLHLGMGDVERCAVLERVQRAAIGQRRRRYIFGALEPPLDLQAVDAGLRIGAQLGQAAQIAGGQKIALAPAHSVFHAAGLSAQAAIAAAPADHGRHQALAGAGHAERAMYEHLELRPQPRAARDLVKTHFARQHHADKALLG